MKYGRYIILSLVCFLLSAMPLCAQRTYSEFERDLGLSETQRARVEQVKRRYMHELQDLNQEYVEKKLELRELERYPYADPERRQRLREELRAIENSRYHLYNRYRADVSRALNRDQRNRYDSFVDTERRRTITPPQSHSSGRYRNPPMNRLEPPPVEVTPPFHGPRQPVAPPTQPRYHTTVPGPDRPISPPPPRGYGR